MKILYVGNNQPVAGLTVGVGNRPGLPAEVKAHIARVRADDGGGTVIKLLKTLNEEVDESTALATNGGTGYKAGTLYSLVPADGDGDFTVTGGGNAVSQRSDGYWETDWLANTPRYKDGGILVEAARQNLITYPRSFGNAYWDKTGATIDDNAGAGYPCPFVDSDGVNTNEGFRLVATSNNGSIKLATPITTTAATTYANGIFIRRITGTGAVSLVDINDTDRAVTITSEWAWYKYAAAAAGVTGQIGVKLAVSGDVVEICHAQLELGAASSSPIYGAENALRTRLADVISKTGAADLIGQTEGTISVNFIVTNFNPVDSKTFISVGDGTIANEINITITTTGNDIAIVARGNSSLRVLRTNEVVAVNKVYQVDAVYKNNTISLYVDGEFIDSGSLTSFSAALNKITIGSRQRTDGTELANDTINTGTIKKTAP